ncbi:MAG: DUF2088 domain-containing protein [Thermoleophilia bacterium]|nr:DUF2088 domain-containing protein [Thermoleophilia bacterium]
MTARDVVLPDLVRVRQRFEAPRVDDVAGRLEALLADSALTAHITPGARVALTAGSRGIRDLVPIMRTVITHVRNAGGEPFLVPCMGSHGGATAEGQAEVLASLGVTEHTVGAPVVSSMDVVAAGESRFGTPVWVARDLAEADAVVVVNRVKPHTDFRGPVESGLVKMLVIGAGKHRGAAEAHRVALRHGFPAVLDEYARLALARLRVIGGIAVIENQRDETAELAVVAADELFTREPELLERARRLTLSLPFDEIDCLVVDEMGKDISGAGLDTNVIGRMNSRCGDATDRPRIARLVVRDLTAASHGNAIGIGMADFTTARLLAAVDLDATAVNCITSMGPEDARLPIAFERDVEAVEAAFATSGAASTAEFSLVWIRNTLALEELLVSTALLPAVAADPSLELVGEPFSFPARGDGSLAPAWGWA